MTDKFPITEKGLKDLCIKFKKDLISELDKKGHHDTGHLEKTIEFKVNKTTKGFELEMESAYYLEYLDKGEFLKKFLKDKTLEMQKDISTNITKDILKQLDL